MSENTVMLAAESRLGENVLELAGRHLVASAEELLVAKLTGDASTRAYYRVRSTRGNAGPDGATSVIIALYGSPFDDTERASSRLTRLESANPAARLTFANDPCAHLEVTDFLLEAGLPVPRIVSVSGKDRALLIEDVGDVRLQDWIGNYSADEVAWAYRTAVGLTSRIQEATGQAIESDSICSRLAFDEAKLGWELDFFFENYFNRYLGLTLNGATVDRVRDDFRSLCAELSALPRVLVHRDYHARNLMMHAGNMFIIDHQDARMGPSSYDAASLLNDPYAGLDSVIKYEMLEHFIELKMASSKPLPDPRAFRREFELVTVQRTLKAVGTYACQSAVMNNPVYLPYIEPALESAVASMKLLGRFSSVRGLLEETCQSIR